VDQAPPQPATAGPVGPRPTPADEPSGKSRSRGLLEWGAVVVGALVVALVIKTFLLQAFYIPSSSMTPTLGVGDRVLVNKLSYDLHDVNRGDLVVFERPESEGGETRDLIKRVIGLPGETVEGQNGQVLVDGRALEEPYLEGGAATGDFEPVEVPDGQVFVMGDNRGDSRDSRFFGPVDQSDIVGRAFLRVWPITDIGGL